MYACSRKNLSKKSFEFSTHKKEYEDLAKNIQNKIFGLPDKKVAIPDWKWFPKFVLAVVTQYNGTAFLRNLRREFVVLGINQAGQEQSDVKNKFLTYRTEFLDMLRANVKALSESPIPDNNGRFERAKQSRKREKLELEATLNRISNITLPDTGDNATAPLKTPYYHELTVPEQEAVFETFWNMDTAASMYWYCK